MKPYNFFGLLTILICGTSFAIDYYDLNDGGHHVINYNVEETMGISYTRVDYDSPGVGTTVDFIEGGWTRNLGSYHDSTINFYGGEVFQTFYAVQNSNITVSGGLISSITAEQQTTIHHQGGQINYLDAGVFPYDECRVVIEKQATLGTLCLYGNRNAEAFIHGGTIGNIEAFGLSVIHVSGGVLSGAMTSGIVGNSFVDETLIRLAGSNFFVNGTAVEPGQYLSAYAVEGLDPYGFLCLTGTVTGILADGNLLDSTFYIADQSDILIVPEPTSLALLGLGTLALRRKK